MNLSIKATKIQIIPETAKHFGNYLRFDQDNASEIQFGNKGRCL